MNSLLARVRSLWRGLRRPERLEAEMEEEMRFHLEMEAERLVRERGLEPGEARRQAAIAFGGMEKRKEEGRDVRGITRVSVSWLDFKLGLRMLAKYPAVTMVGGLAIALGIGIGAATFELVKRVTHPAPPFGDDRIVAIVHLNGGEADRPIVHDFFAWREQVRSVEELAAFRFLDQNLMLEEGIAEPADVAESTASAFRMGPSAPLLGRTLVDEDERPGAPRVAILAQRVWETRFGSDPEVVGRTIRLDGVEHTVVGVMPEEFELVPGDAIVPLRLDPLDFPRAEAPSLFTFGRLAPGVSRGEAQAEMEVIGRRAALDFPATHARLRPEVVPFMEGLLGLRIRGPVRAGVYSINLLAALFVALVCANVSILVFARTAARDSELVVRSALGASRARIVMQLFVEALVLGVVAAGAGLLAARVALRWAIFALVGDDAPLSIFEVSISPLTMLYAALLTVLGAALVGAVPALKVTGRRADGSFRRVGAGDRGLRFSGVWTGVIVAQVALTFVGIPFLIDAALDARALRDAEIGFESGEFLGARLELDDGMPRAYDELERRLLAEPAVAAVTYASALPGEYHARRWIEVEGVVPPDSAFQSRLQTADVDPGFFAALGAPLVAGRGFDAGDLEAEAHTVVVNRTFVDVFLGGRNAIGARVRYLNAADPYAGPSAESEPGPWHEIVGVVSDVALTLDPELPHRAGLYHPVAPVAPQLRLAVRTRGDPGSSRPLVRAAASAADPTLRVDDLTPLVEIQGRQLRQYLTWLQLGVIAGALLLLLSFAGIYSVMSFTVSRRTREVGIRLALGADRRRIVVPIFVRAFGQFGLGILAGVLLLLALLASIGGSVQSLRGLAIVGSGVALMALVGLLACLVPTRRALRIQPTEALRHE